MSQTSYSGTLDKAQLEGLWDQAGGPPGDANLASAIALAESAGKEKATDNNTNGTTDRGYWQINSIHGNLSTYEPLGNAKAAVTISHGGTDFTPWVTYTTGAYKQYLGQGGTSSASTQTPSTTSTNETTPTSGNPLLPKGRGTGNALKYLAYALLFTIGAALLYQGITRTTHPGTST